MLFLFLIFLKNFSFCHKNLLWDKFIFINSMRLSLSVIFESNLK